MTNEATRYLKRAYPATLIVWVVFVVVVCLISAHVAHGQECSVKRGDSPIVLGPHDAIRCVDGQAVLYSDLTPVPAQLDPDELKQMREFLKWWQTLRKMDCDYGLTTAGALTCFSDKAKHEHSADCLGADGIYQPCKEKP